MVPMIEVMARVINSEMVSLSEQKKSQICCTKLRSLVLKVVTPQGGLRQALNTTDYVLYQVLVYTVSSLKSVALF